MELTQVYISWIKSINSIENGNDIHGYQVPVGPPKSSQGK